jgi:hypothetical protein
VLPASFFLVCEMVGQRHGRTKEKMGTEGIKVPKAFSGNWSACLTRKQSKGRARTTQSKAY